MTEYLPENSNVRMGLQVMEDEFNEQDNSILHVMFTSLEEDERGYRHVEWFDPNSNSSVVQDSLNRTETSVTLDAADAFGTLEDCGHTLDALADALITTLVSGSSIVVALIEKNAKSNRSKNPPARRVEHKSRKEAYERAKRDGRGREPRHDPNGHDGDSRPHYHPDVPHSQRTTPKIPSSHDHHYYPRR